MRLNDSDMYKKTQADFVQTVTRTQCVDLM